MSKSEKQKTCIVTGAGRGIGYCISKSMQGAGYSVIGLDKEFKKDRKSYSFPTKKMDLSRSEDIKESCSWICKNFEKVDVLVNCAGITIPSINHYSYEKWKSTFLVNLDAPFLLIEGLKSHVIAAKGSIINISSLNGKIAFPDNPAYVSSKTGLDGLTRAYALELGKFGVRVNSIAPGYIRTEMTGDSWSVKEKRKKREERTMLKRWGTPDDLVGPVLFLASNHSAYVTGQTLYVDGGWSSKGF